MPLSGYRKPSTGIPASHLATPLGWGELAAGYYYTMSSHSVTTSAVHGNGSLRLAPWFVPNACTIDRIGAEVTSAGEAGSTVRLGIYADNGSGYPGALVLDAGTIDGTSATVQQITISQALTPGLHWIGGAVQGAPTTQPTVRVPVNWTSPVPLNLGASTPGAASTSSGYFQASVTGALPGTFTSTVTSSGGQIVIRTFVRVA